MSFNFEPFLLLPLVCGLSYVLGLLVLKRAAVFGVGLWRAAFVTNWVGVLLVVPWCLPEGLAPVPWAQYAQPLMAGCVFFGAQTLLFVAFTRGDVSVVAPVMGVKVIFVALLSTVLLASRLSPVMWVAAGMSAGAMFSLNVGGESLRGRRVGRTVALTMMAAGWFALSDVMIQHWAPGWGGAKGFLPPLFLVVGLCSFVLLRFARGGLGGLGARAWRWVLAGALLNALTNIGIAYSLSHWGQATAVNIAYSSRGLFSVLIVWLVGHWFGNDEGQVQRRVLIARLAGAAAIVAAICLAG